MKLKSPQPPSSSRQNGSAVVRGDVVEALVKAAHQRAEQAAGLTGKQRKWPAPAAGPPPLKPPRRF